MVLKTQDSVQRSNVAERSLDSLHARDGNSNGKMNAMPRMSQANEFRAQLAAGDIRIPCRVASSRSSFR
jgi:hypothetical protein